MICLHHFVSNKKSELVFFNLPYSDVSGVRVNESDAVGRVYWGRMRGKRSEAAN